MRRPGSVVLCLSLLLAVTACGDSKAGTTAADCGQVTTPVKPKVSTPKSLPTKLSVNDLVTGNCSAAAALGDTVIVNYVGVRTATGDEFDNSYDGGEPLDVLLGAGTVIPGWEQGLVGVKQGGRRQLDIPADLAYGDSPPSGSTIKAGDALTFVVEVVAVLPGSKAEDDPGIKVSGGANIAAIKSTDLVGGTGPSPKDGQTVAIRIVAYRADTGALLDSNWGTPPLSYSYSTSSDVYPGLIAAVKGMKVGGRRQTQIPFTLMFDGEGNTGLGLPASIDLTVVIDLVAVY